MRISRPAATAGLTALLLSGMALAPVASADYPPQSEIAGAVLPNRIDVGQCARFSGMGFQVGTGISITDNGEERAPTTTNDNGEFTSEMCYDAETESGPHTLTGTGMAPDGAGQQQTTALRGFFAPAKAHADVLRTVTVVLFVEGISQNVPLPREDGTEGTGGTDAGALGPGTASGSPLARTGVPVLVLVGVGVGLTTVGAGLVLASEQRHRRRRRAFAPSAA